MKSKKERDEWLARRNARVDEKRDQRLAAIREKHTRRQAEIDQRLHDSTQKRSEPAAQPRDDVDRAVRRVDFWNPSSPAVGFWHLVFGAFTFSIPRFPTLEDHRMAALRRAGLE